MATVQVSQGCLQQLDEIQRILLTSRARGDAQSFYRDLAAELSNLISSMRSNQQALAPDALKPSHLKALQVVSHMRNPAPVKCMSMPAKVCIS